eukprot:Sspe_Gene.16653::Locus_5876_Transcript_1_1_Confidence_1.000_Length_1128::g.16653::m.16653
MERGKLWWLVLLLTVERTVGCVVNPYDGYFAQNGWFEVVSGDVLLRSRFEVLCGGSRNYSVSHCTVAVTGGSGTVTGGTTESFVSGWVTFDNITVTGSGEVTLTFTAEGAVPYVKTLAVYPAGEETVTPRLRGVEGHTGILELYNRNTSAWNYVCYTTLYSQTANLACRDMGYVAGDVEGYDTTWDSTPPYPWSHLCSTEHSRVRYCPMVELSLSGCSAAKVECCAEDTHTVVHSGPLVPGDRVPEVYPGEVLPTIEVRVHATSCENAGLFADLPYINISSPAGLSGTLSMPLSHGRATFSDITFTGPVGMTTVTFSAPGARDLTVEVRVVDSLPRLGVGNVLELYNYSSGAWNHFCAY